VLTVGLTGGIGSGKSEVARLLAAHGAVVIDADRLAPLQQAMATGDSTVIDVSDGDVPAETPEFDGGQPVAADGEVADSDGAQVPGSNGSEPVDQPVAEDGAEQQGEGQDRDNRRHYHSRRRADEVFIRCRNRCWWVHSALSPVRVSLLRAGVRMPDTARVTAEVQLFSSLPSAVWMALPRAMKVGAHRPT